MERHSETLENPRIDLVLRASYVGHSSRNHHEMSLLAKGIHPLLLFYENANAPPQQYEISLRLAITTPFTVIPPEFARLSPGPKLSFSEISQLQKPVISISMRPNP
ncbi:MAG: hypothetical protein M2R45_03408 [Verrucomicrobia subdivision 3 bacterium]|nr:hypothetical protein [Limisphaerales bacterium]MCS1416313.1 hypothetical protein [Limisphaerales bacterium]